MKTMNHLIRLIILSTILVTTLTGEYSYGQDIIVQRNGEEIKAKVHEVLDTEVKYHKFDNLSGPLYTIRKADVFMIKYENGTKDVFSNQNYVAPQYQSNTVASRKFTFNDIQPAKNSATCGYILVVPIFGLGFAAGCAGMSSTDDALMYGIPATAIAAIGIPVSTIGAAKTRRITGVEGNKAARIAGWICYGFAITDALTMLTLAEEFDFSGGPAFGVAALASAASILLALDASHTYRQAKSMQSGFNLQPTIGIGRDLAGNRFNTVGVCINF